MALRTRTSEKTVAAGGDARVEDELTKRGIPFKFELAVPADKFDLERSRNNQARFEAIDEKLVEQYTDAIKRGDVFPPVVAYQRSGLYVVVDGNHRLAAHIAAKKPLRVYDVSGAPADSLNFLAIWFNTKHGKATSEAERIAHALYLINNGTTLADASATVNLPMRIVQRAYQSKTADQRFIDNNIPTLTVEKMHESLKKRLAQISTDEGFVAAVDLAVRAKFGQAEVFKLVQELSDLRSSAKQVAHVKVWEGEFADQIAGSAGGVFTRRTMTPKTRTQMALSQITGLPDDLASVASQWAGPERDEMAKRAKQAATRLNQLARLLAQ